MCVGETGIGCFGCIGRWLVVGRLYWLFSYIRYAVFFSEFSVLKVG